MPLNNRTILAIGVGVAAVLAIVLALVFSRGADRNGDVPPADRGGLTVDVADAPGLEPTRELRCFVDGQFIGMATDALDVGLDETGALAAAPTASFAPPPSLPPVVIAEIEPLPTPVTPNQPAPAPAPVATGSACLRHTGSDWRSLSPNMGLNACVMALYSGTCVRPGEALYGRWGDTTLRLVPRRVEQSSDNSRFRTLAEQDRNCQFPGLS